jgi:DNA-binding CsgD family transcriptional regulator/tetratricopeptide (TPR) repeat protein
MSIEQTEGAAMSIGSVALDLGGQLARSTYASGMELVERADQLEILAALLDDAKRGEGRMALIGGEAGAGKSALVSRFCDTQAAGTSSLYGACEPLSAPRPLGPLIDIAAGLDPVLLKYLHDGDRAAAFEAALAALGRETDARVLVFEDIHWADEATLDLLQVLGRRIRSMHVLVLATYRDDDLARGHPLRLALGDLVSAPAVRRLAVPPLSVDAVRRLATNRDIDAESLHRDTAGNAFFVSEVLAAGPGRLPVSLADAVLTRVDRLPETTRRALEAAAVAGPRAEPSLLLAMAEVDGASLDACVGSGLLQLDPPNYVFRHELARQAVLTAIPAQRLSGLHAQVLSLLRRSESTEGLLARLSDHAEQAADPAAVLEFAPAAGRAASELLAHREAAFQYGRALRFADHVEPAERAALLELRGCECYLVDLLDEAADAHQQAAQIWRDLGDLARAADNLRQLGRALWMAGKTKASDTVTREALEILEELPPGIELARVYAAQSGKLMLACESDESIALGDRAIALATELGDTNTLVQAYNNVGVSRWRQSDPAGEQMLLESLRLARSAGLDNDAARAFGNLAATASELLDYDKAVRYLAEGVAYCSDHDLTSKMMCLQAEQTGAFMFLGQWDEATELAEALLEKLPGTRVTRLSVLVVLGRIRAARGDDRAGQALDEAREIAAHATELQFLGSVVSARAEARWLTGDVAAIDAEVREAFELACRVGDPTYCGELALWLKRAGTLAASPDLALPPHRKSLAGDHRGAYLAWRELGCPYDAALALADSDDVADLREALTLFDSLGATAAVSFVNAKLRAAGVVTIRRGPRSTTRSNPSRLTDREVDVLRLVERGKRDAEIAADLYVSPRTVEHHVSSILAKLDVSSRREAAELARELLPQVQT